MIFMTLFKYIRPERLDVIEKREIRFTQPAALNDPFELRPQFESLVGQAEVLATLNNVPVDLDPVIKQAYDMLPESYREFMSYDVAAKTIRALMATKQTREATSQGLRSFLTLMNDGASLISEKIYEVLNS